MHLVSGTMGSDETGDGTLENPFATIGHAMFNMNNNDWILVAPGLYEESLNSYEMSGLLIGLAGPDSTFISGSGQNEKDINFVFLNVDWWINIFGWQYS